MNTYDLMPTSELAYHRSEIKAQLKPYWFRKLSATQKREFRVLKLLLKQVDDKLQARQLRLPGF